MTEQPRCAWATTPEMIAYHDKEWGVPEHEDAMLFELLTLEGAQAGLSWATVLKKRANYRKVFENFDLEVVAAFDQTKIDAALSDPGIIRNRAKVLSTVGNARVLLAIQHEFGSFDAYIWSFTKRRRIVTHRASDEPLPASTELSLQISSELKKRGCNFVGPTIIYSYLQAIGVIDDHYAECFCAHRKMQKQQPKGS